MSRLYLCAFWSVAARKIMEIHNMWNLKARSKKCGGKKNKNISLTNMTFTGRHYLELH